MCLHTFVIYYTTSRKPASEVPTPRCVIFYPNSDVTILPSSGQEFASNSNWVKVFFAGSAKVARILAPT